MNRIYTTETNGLNTYVESDEGELFHSAQLIFYRARERIHCGDVSTVPILESEVDRRVYLEEFIAYKAAEIGSRLESSEYVKSLSGEKTGRIRK